MSKDNLMKLPEIFQSIADKKETGTLTIQSGEQRKYIYFKGGKVLQVSSPQRPSMLATALRRYPDLDDESFEYLCEKQKEKGESLYNILLAEEKGSAFIISLCQYQIIEEVCEIFNWPDPIYEFAEGEPSPSLFESQLLTLDINIDTTALITEAGRRQDQWKLIREAIPSNYDVPYRVKGRDVPETSVEELAVLNLVNGVRDISEIAEEVRLSPFLALKALTQSLNHGVIALKTGSQLRRMADMDIFRRDRLKCIRLYERAESLGEEELDVLSWLALSYEAMGMMGKAAEKYRQVGFICIKDGMTAGAIRAFEKVAALDPQDLEAPKMLIALCYTSNEPEKAAAKTLDYARRLALKGNLDLAIQVLKQATERAGVVPDNLDFLATLHHERGSHAEAIETYNILAEYYRGKNNHEAEVATYKKILKVDKDCITVRMAIAKGLASLGRHKEALEEYRNFGRSLYSSGKMNELSYYLMRAAENILEQEPGNSEAYMWLADAALARSDKKRAKDTLVDLLGNMEQTEGELPVLIEIYTRLVSMEPDNLEYRKWLADAYQKMDKVREAMQEYYNLGMAASDASQDSHAMDAFDAFLSLSFERSHFAVRLKRANLLIKLGRNEEAINELKLIGYLSSGIANYRKSVDAFCRVVTIEPDEQLPCYEDIAKLYQKLGDTQRAIVSYQKYAKRHIKHKNFGEALRICDKILSIDQEYAWAVDNKKKLLSILDGIEKTEKERPEKEKTEREKPEKEKTEKKSATYQMQMLKEIDLVKDSNSPSKTSSELKPSQMETKTKKRTEKTGPPAFDPNAQKRLQDLFERLSKDSEKYPSKEDKEDDK